MSPPKKIGRPSSNKSKVFDRMGNLVDGLSYDPRNKSYYTYYKDDDGKYHKKGFRSDYDRAIVLYKQWLKERGESYVEIDYSNVAYTTKEKVTTISFMGNVKPEIDISTKKSLNDIANNGGNVHIPIMNFADLPFF